MLRIIKVLNNVLAKRITENQKKEIKKDFINGKSIDEIANDYKFSKLTISRNLKNLVGIERYKIINNSKKISNSSSKEKNDVYSAASNENHLLDTETSNESYPNNETPVLDTFIEISPLNVEIESSDQKDLASVPLETVDFPNIVFMVVNKKIELEVKYLRNYPKWEFLSDEDLNRKTIEIFFDLQTAKRICKKDEKVIKVPNTNVFKIVAPILNKRGISRIIFDEKLIAI